MTWLSTKQAAARLGIHADTLRRYRRIGGGPPFSRIGRAVRYRIEALEAWMGERLVASTAQEAAASSGAGSGS